VTSADYAVLAISIALVTLLAIVLVVSISRLKIWEMARQDAHERRAQEREKRAIERHDLQVRALDHNRAMTLQAVNQRLRLEDAVGELDKRVTLLEAR
jgi:type VI protein secretion system component VasK